MRKIKNLKRMERLDGLQRRAAFGHAALMFMPAAQAARRAIRCSRFSVVSS